MGNDTQPCGSRSHSVARPVIVVRTSGSRSYLKGVLECLSCCHPSGAPDFKGDLDLSLKTLCVTAVTVYRVVSLFSYKRDFLLTSWF